MRAILAASTVFVALASSMCAENGAGTPDVADEGRQASPAPPDAADDGSMADAAFMPDGPAPPDAAAPDAAASACADAATSSYLGDRCPDGHCSDGSPCYALWRADPAIDWLTCVHGDPCAVAGCSRSCYVFVTEPFEPDGGEITHLDCPR
jgi:hypothetical protein